MNIKIEKFNFGDTVQVQALSRWDCDKELYHLITPVRDKKAATEYPTFEDVLKKYKDPGFSKGVYVIWDNNKPIGNLSILIDPPHLMRKIPDTSWLGLIIGERE